LPRELNRGSKKSQQMNTKMAEKRILVFLLLLPARKI